MSVFISVSVLLGTESLERIILIQQTGLAQRKCKQLLIIRDSTGLCFKRDTFM